MKTLRLAFPQLPFTLVMLLLAGPDGRSAEPEPKQAAAGQPDDSSPKDALAKDRLKYMTNAMQKYTVILDGDEDKKATLEPTARFRWLNPVGDVVDGLLTVYSLEAKLDGKQVWTKPEAGDFGNPTGPHYMTSYRGDPGEAPMKSLFPTPEP
jgi:hypothetical protein